jgi:hypothetical protein
VIILVWRKKALYGDIWGGSSRRPRSAKDCRARTTTTTTIIIITIRLV